MSAIHQLITNHIDIWTAADTEKKSGRGRSSGNGTTVYGIKKLRELILELAVRGKLVPQDPNDEPASELLKKINLAKVELIAAGKIKKEKPLPEIPKEETPFPIPPNWEWTRLGEITNFGYTYKPDVIRNDTWVLDLEDIEKDTSRLVQKVKFSERKSLSDKNIFHIGDVLYGKLRPYLNKVIVADEMGVCTTEILPFRCYGPFDSDYFKNALKSPYFIAYVDARSYGMKMPRLGTEDGRKAFFPLPPLKEQHRVVAKVDELMALCDQLETQHNSAAEAHEKLVSQLLPTLTQSKNAEEFSENWQRIAAHFDTLFTTEASIDDLKKTVLELAAGGGLDSLSEEAPELILSDLLVEDSLNGCSKKPSEEVSGVPILRISAGTGSDDFFVDESDYKWVELSSTEINKFLLAPDDLLACRFNGNLHYVGSFALYRASSGVSQVFPDKLIRFRTNKNLALPNYLRYVLNASQARKQIESFCATTVGNIGISATNLKTIKVRIPTIEEQNQIVGKVDKLMSLCDQLKSRITEANRLQQKLADVMVEQALGSEFQAEEAEVPNRDEARALLGAEIIHQLHTEKTFGQVKLQKIVHLSEYIAELQALAGEYRRYARGPHDPEIISDIELAIKQNEWYEEYPREKVGHAYRPLPHAGAHRKKMGVYWQEKLPIIQKLIDVMRKWDTERCEIVSTLYAAWNDLLIFGKPISNEAILSEVLEHWHANKTKIPKRDWLIHLRWMRKYGYIPRGSGRATRRVELFD